MVGPMTQGVIKAASCPEFERYEVTLPEGLQSLTDEEAAIVVALVLHERDEHDRLLTELAQVKAARDELQVQVTEWELTAVREGLLCRGDIEQ